MSMLSLKPALLILILSLKLVACGGGLPGAPPPSAIEPVTTIAGNGVVQSVQSGITLELRTDKTVYQSGENINFTARLQNDSAYTLYYYLSSPCAPELDIHFDGSDIFSSRTALGGYRGPMTACSGVIVNKELVPGASVEYSESWDQKLGTHGVVYDLPAGEYPVNAVFRGSLDDGSLAGVEVSHKVTLNVVQEKTVVWWTPKNALLEAMQLDEVVSWRNAGGERIACELPNGFTYQLSDLGELTAIGIGEYQDSSTKCLMSLNEGPAWRTRFSSKKPGITELVVDVSALTGEILLSQ